MPFNSLTAKYYWLEPNIPGYSSSSGFPSHDYEFLATNKDTFNPSKV